MITGAAQMDGAILVVSAADGPMPQTRASTSCCRVRSACPTSSSSGTRLTWSTTKSCSSWSKWKCASCCPSTMISPATTPHRQGFWPSWPLEGDKGELGEEAIMKLADALDCLDSIPTPERAVDKTFLMPVEDVFSISAAAPW